MTETDPTTEKTGDGRVPATDALLAFFKTFSDVNRLRTAGLLASEPRTVEQIAAALGLTRPQAARHLSYLAHEGVAASDDGNLYRFQTAAFLEMTRVILAQAPASPAGSDDLEDAERKVIADFTTADGRLKRLPVQYKKQLIVLRYVNEVFARGERYPEKQVNQILARFHEDTASLRRALVDNGLMTRQNGIYWRIDEQQDPAQP